MNVDVGFSGLGHALGSTVVSNSDVATSLGREPDWLVAHTGVVERRICAVGEDVLSLAADAVTHACEDAKLDLQDLGHETLLLHVQNGLTHITPSAGVVLGGQLGLSNVRVLGLDGVCAEPLAALEAGLAVLRTGGCQRVIISAASDFVPYVNPQDPVTAGLFGAGAGALVLSGDTGRDPEVLVRGLHWETHTRHWQLGEVEIHRRQKTESGVEVAAGFYETSEKSLSREVQRKLPGVVGHTLEQAGWSSDEVELVVSHQPNARMLEAVCPRMGIDPARCVTSLRRLGNLGPAGLLVDLSIARGEGRLTPGTRVLLLAFGIGFSCAAAAIEI